MCTRIRLPELALDELVCGAREALDLARIIALRTAAKLVSERYATPTERSAAMQEYVSAIYALERCAKNRAGLAASPFR